MRQAKGWSLAKFAEHVHYSPGYLSKVESGKRPPTVGLARTADAVLGTEGELEHLARNARARLLLPARPAQLPPGVANFVGREPELTMLDSLIGSAEPGVARLAVIHGPPGVGKTAVAVRWGHRDAAHFPDGILYIDLRGMGCDEALRPHDVLGRFLIALGVRQADLPELTEARADLMRTVLADARVLIVLDNAGDVDQVKPLLPGPSCCVVVTARAHMSQLLLDTGGISVPVGPLREDDGVLLLRKLLGDERVDQEPYAAQLISQRCGNLPLALRIVAQQIIARPGRTLGDLAEWLGTEDKQLDVLDVDGSPTMRCAFGVSYRALSPEHRRVFRHLGLHRGADIGVDAVAALAGISAESARHALSALCTVHLIEEVRLQRYATHDLIHAYARELCEHEDDPAECERAVRRLLEWYLATAANANHVLAPFRDTLDLPEPTSETAPLQFANCAEARAWCDREVDNLVAAVRRAGDADMPGLSWRLAVSQVNYYLLAKPHSAWVTVHTMGLNAARKAGDKRGIGACLQFLGFAYAEQRHFPRAIAAFMEAIEIRESIRDREGAAWSTFSLGDTYMKLGDYPHADLLLAKAREMFEVAESAYGAVVAQAVHGECARYFGRLEESREILIDALAQARTLRVDDAEILALIKLAATEIELGRHADAMAHLDTAIVVSRQRAYPFGEAHAMLVRGRALAIAGQSHRARTCLNRARDLFDWLQSPIADDARAELAALDDQVEPPSLATTSLNDGPADVPPGGSDALDLA